MLQVFQRQLSKEGLQAVVNGGEAEKGGGGWSSEDLRDLFTLRKQTASDTYDSRCKSPDPDECEASQDEADYQPPVYQEQVKVTSARPCHANIVHQTLSGSMSCQADLNPKMFVSMFLTQLVTQLD